MAQVAVLEDRRQAGVAQGGQGVMGRTDEVVHQPGKGGPERLDRGSHEVVVPGGGVGAGDREPLDQGGAGADQQVAVGSYPLGSERASWKGALQQPSAVPDSKQRQRPGCVVAGAELLQAGQVRRLASQATVVTGLPTGLEDGRQPGPVEHQAHDVPGRVVGRCHQHHAWPGQLQVLGG